MSDPAANLSHEFLVRQLAAVKEQNKALLQSGGGGGTFDGMEARVSAMEKRFDRFEAKLDTLVTDTAEMKGRLMALPSARDFGELKGRVDSLPTTAKIAGLITIGVGVLAIVTKWSALFGALPTN